MRRENCRKEEAVARLRELYGRYGYSQYRMRKFEEYDLYVRNKDFLLSDHMITFTEPSGKLMALKPDVTLSIAKSFRDTPGSMQKVYYQESVYRVDKDNHAFKEITQVGLECMGDGDDYSMVEVLLLAAESLRAIGEDFVLDISHLGIVSSVWEAAGVPGAYRQALLRCLGEKNAHGAAALCREAGIAEEKASAIISLITTYGAPQKVLPALAELPLDPGGAAALASLRALFSVLEAEIGADHLRIDFSVINDMNYYNGIVFRGFLSGIPSGILSGGQYDYLMQKMGKNAAAIGFAVYPDLLESTEGETSRYDVDTLLLYRAGEAPATVRAAVRALSEEVGSVMVQRAIPGKLRYRRLCQLTERGVETIEEHA